MDIYEPECVREVRQWRDRFYEETKDMDTEALLRYIQERAASFRKAVEEAKRRKRGEQ